MKVAIVSNFPVYSGTGKVPYALWQNLRRENLAAADFFLTHFMNAADHHLPEYQGQNGFRVLHPFDYMISPTLNRLMIYFLDGHLLPKSYDLYHFGNQMIARLAAFRRPAVVTVHDVLQFKYWEKFKSGLASRIYNYFMSQSLKTLPAADHLICVSNWSKGELLRQFPQIAESKVSVVYNGLDHLQFRPGRKNESRRKLGLPEAKKIILHLGSEIPRKQVPLLLTALPQIKMTEPEAILLRHGESTRDSQNLIKRLGLSKEVFYRDQTAEADLPDYYRAADLLVVPSSEEGFCLPIIEAMACGTPVVATNLTSLPEITGGAQAETIAELSESAVAEAIIKVLNMDSTKIGEIRLKGFENAARFSWSKAARETCRIYNEVLKL